MNTLFIAATWFVAQGSVACTTYEALNISHRIDVDMAVTSMESIKFNNECTMLTIDTPTMPQAIGVYAKAEMLSYDGKRKVYFINSRDLRKK